MGLKEYQARRNFKRTAEPAGKIKSRRRRGWRFVIQKHDATRLHYDFRLVMEGVFKSWAVPKGFPFNKGDRRLAVEVEDHPLEYGGFEGTIPPGNYGAGTVMVWDNGTYEVSGDDPLKAWKEGKLHLLLRGKKLIGEWTLVRMRGSEKSGRPQWLLIKSGKDAPPISRTRDDQSAVSRRTMKQIATQNERQWQSDRLAKNPKRQIGGRVNIPRGVPKPASVSTQSARVVAPQINLERLPRTMPEFREPMKALLVDTLPKGESWIYELKFDGIRALAIQHHGKVRLVSRSGKDLTAKYPQIADAFSKLPTREAMFDGEIVALDPEGRSSFQLLQSYEMAGGGKPPLFYYVFDLVNLEGKDLAQVPIFQRKAMAQTIIERLPSVIRFSSGMKAASENLMREMKARGLEGLIAKRQKSQYEYGRRSGAWVKFKWTNEQEFVIGGYTPPKGSRSKFGAILVGYYESKRLLFAGKVGTGFDEKTLELLYAKFQKLIQPTRPFFNLPEKLTNSGSKGMTASEMKRCTWLQPKLVCQVRFAEWTRDHHLRQPAFLGLREDRRPEEVVRERPN